MYERANSISLKTQIDQCKKNKTVFFTEKMIKVITSVPKGCTASDDVIDAFDHIWRPVVDANAQYSKNNLPPPFEAFGNCTQWILVECRVRKCTGCAEYTMDKANAFQKTKETLLKKSQTIFGITRNRKHATSYRTKRLQLKKDEEEEEMEESSSSSSYVSSSSEEEIEEEEKDEESEIEDVESSTDSSSS